jgi:WhiB family redox-sensing transcriptional regulator
MKRLRFVQGRVVEFDRPEWLDGAACRGAVEAFFPPEPAREAAYAAAKAVCAECGVRDECGKVGRDEPYGCWGGQTPDERRQARRSAA